MPAKAPLYWRESSLPWLDRILLWLVEVGLMWVSWAVRYLDKPWWTAVKSIYDTVSDKVWMLDARRHKINYNFFSIEDLFKKYGSRVYNKFSRFIIFRMSNVFPNRVLKTKHTKKQRILSLFLQKNIQIFWKINL